MNTPAEKPKRTRKAKGVTVTVEAFERLKELAALGEQVEAGAMVPREQLEDATAALSALEGQVEELQAALVSAKQIATQKQIQQETQHRTEPAPAPMPMPAPVMPMPPPMQSDQMLAYASALRAFRAPRRSA